MSCLEGGAKKSKSGLGDPDLAEDGTLGRSWAKGCSIWRVADQGLDSAKSRKRKKKTQPDVSTADGQDDVDKTITALLIRRMHADPEAFSGLVTEIVSSRPDVLAADPPPTGARKGSGLETGPSPEENQQLSKLRRPSATQDNVEQDTTLATQAPLKEKTATAGPRPTADHHAIATRPSESESSPVRRKKTAHTLEGRSAIKGGTSVITPATQPEVNVNSRPVASEGSTSTLRTSTANSQLVPSTGNALRVPSFPEGSASGMRLRTGMKPTIPEGLEISGVPIEARGEGSSDESSSEDEDEDEERTVPLAKPTTSIGDPSIPMNLLEDQLSALIRGPEKRGPRRSVLDEIPSSSETGSESSPEDLMLDEEEDLSRQPSRKQNAFSKNRLSSIEPETGPSEDEGSSSLHVFMDVSSFFFSMEASRGEIDKLCRSILPPVIWKLLPLMLYPNKERLNSRLSTLMRGDLLKVRDRVARVQYRLRQAMDMHQILDLGLRLVPRNQM